MPVTRGSTAAQSRRIRSATAGTGRGFQSSAVSVPPRTRMSPCGNRYTSSVVASGSPMKNSVSPGFSATTTWPRNARTPRSKASSRAPDPVQFSTAWAPCSAPAPASDRTTPASNRPPAAPNLARR